MHVGEQFFYIRCILTEHPYHSDKLLQPNSYIKHIAQKHITMLKPKKKRLKEQSFDQDH